MRNTMLMTLLLTLTLTACGEGRDSPREGRDGRNGREEGEGARENGRGSISDAQIAALVALINGTEIASSKAVQPKLVAPPVREYAGTLMADHVRLTEAMPSFDGPSTPAPQTETLNAVFHSQAAMLSTLPAGYPFDATFVAIQVADHAMAIDSLRRWHSVARERELRRALAAAIPVMESHLERAKALYTSLDQRVDLGRPGPPDTVPPTTPPGPATVPADTAAETAEGGHHHGGGRR